jgi:hypothetical protein
MFIEETKPIELKIHYRKVGRGYVAYSDAEFKAAELEPELRMKYKELNVKMKPLTWDLYNDLQESSFLPEDATGRKKFNFKVYKYNKLMQLISSWDATTSVEGKIVPVVLNEKNIKLLSPDIAEAIITAYDNISMVSEDEEKKS